MTRRLILLTLLLGGLCSPADAAFSLIASGGTAASGANSTTTIGATTTGASLLVVACNWYSGTTATVTVSDSNSNTWVALTKMTSSGAVSSSQLFYVNSVTPTVGAAHTFTCAGTSVFASVGYQAWANSAASPFDGETGNIDGGNAQTTGSLTPSQANDVVITAVATFNGTTISINGGFTTNYTSDFVGGASEGGGMAYLVQTSATAANPTWASSSSTDVAAVIAAFKAGATSGGATSGLSLLGVGR